MRRPLLVLVALLAVTLAGCTGGGGDSDGPAAVSGCVGDACGDITLGEGRGAVSGLLIDDRYRPVPEAAVLLLPLGLQTATNENGEFGFVDLEPGTYTVKVSKDKHEAAPKRVDVTAGQFAETIVEARRTFEDNSVLLTQEFSVFIPCNLMFVVNGLVSDCGTDLSGDNFRADFSSDYSRLRDVTWLVTEMKANQPDAYNIQVRSDATYAALTSFDPVDYLRVANQVGVLNEEANYFGDNQPWQNDGSFQTILFVMEEFAGEAHDLGQATGLGGVLITGVGASLGVKARFVQSLFIGEPIVDVASYSVLA